MTGLQSVRGGNDADVSPSARVLSGALFVKSRGLHRREFEHDSCGVGFVADMRRPASHKIIEYAVEILENLVHRGAVGADPKTGDGAGLLFAVPDDLFRADLAARGVELPPLGSYAVGVFFLPRTEDARRAAIEIVEARARERGLSALAWRDIPVDRATLNDETRKSEPIMRQFFVGRGDIAAGDDFERALYLARRQIERAGKAVPALQNDGAAFHCASFSSRVVVYKGMLLAEQVAPYFSDLRDPRAKSRFAIFHQRFSTNTFPCWTLAHPYRMIAHNGEINTLRGNINNMRAREGALRSDLWGDDLRAAAPVVEEGQSDTASLDNAVEFLRLSGYSLARTMAILIPEAWQNRADMPPALRDFYRHHAAMMEPWDGPAGVVFSDGLQIGATLDRNGLRPGRYWITRDGLVVMASEAGVLRIPDSEIVEKWRLEPGRILLVDLEAGRLVADDEIKSELASKRPWRRWADDSQIDLDSLPACRGDGERVDSTSISDFDLRPRQIAFGCTAEDIKFVLRPMMENAAEAIGAMGDDAPQAALSAQAKPLAQFFRQEFAQVTNPPIDPIREEIVMSLNSYLGPRPNLLAADRAPETAALALSHPALTEAQIARVKNIADLTDGRITARTLDATFAVAGGAAAMETEIEKLRERALGSVKNGAGILVLSDRRVDSARAPIPMPLAVSAAHHALIEAGCRAAVGLVAETGAAREVHDFAVLAGFGAEAVYPYLAYRSLLALDSDLPPQKRIDNYRAAVGKGVLKIMSKMGVSTFQSYCGAQIFEAVGLSSKFVDRYFCRAVTQIEGADIEDIAADSLRLHEAAYGERASAAETPGLPDGGDYAVRARGEAHLWTSDSISKLQHAARGGGFSTYREFADLIDRQDRRLVTLRGMLDIREAETPIPIEEVEAAEKIVARFSTGAMSFGSISREAHTTLAVAMNRIGGKSNTGEGGEEADRYIPLANGDSMRSAIKQVASGRFGVTAEYLANADMMQIKIAQGAKPGEGGQLPGHKVDAAIGAVRHSVPGVGLISPPPHHDIYSIEDIAQLIYDLKCANPKGLVSVKLVSRCGVGTVAAGVAKAKSDHITIAGHDGGTGASPISSIKRAGTPWELGLAETHQTLLMNGLRARVGLQVDGQIKTGRDVIIGALLGADEFGFATAPLVAAGCLMMRKCHLNTCPVGIATQDPVLRRKFEGKPEHVVNYFFFVAEDARRRMAAMGFRTFDDLIGRVDLLSPRPQAARGKAAKIDLRPLLTPPAADPRLPRRHCERQNHRLDLAFDQKLVAAAREVLQSAEQSAASGGGGAIRRVDFSLPIQNLDRAAGATLSYEVVRRIGGKGFADDTIVARLAGVAGQSFGAFLARGITLSLEGEANDYVGKGLSGGIVAVFPPPSPRRDGENIICGNTTLYGATAGRCFLRGAAGERFAVRNSGARAVVEGAGDHCCEYMTGGVVAVLGATGRNFAAGMSGGVAYVLDDAGDFESRCDLRTAALEPLLEKPAPGQPEGRADADILRELLEEHLERTKSPLAAEILSSWPGALSRFVKVFPHEYRRALIELARAQKAA